MRTYYSLSEGMKRGMKPPLSVYMLAQQMVADGFNVSAVEDDGWVVLSRGKLSGWEIVVSISNRPAHEELAERLMDNGFKRLLSSGQLLSPEIISKVHFYHVVT